MAWYTSPLYPWNWPSDIMNAISAGEKYVTSKIEDAILYLFADFLNTLYGIISSIFGFLMIIFKGVVRDLVWVAEGMGPFSVPVFVIIITSLIGAAYLAFAMVKDTPVVGALA